MSTKYSISTTLVSVYSKHMVPHYWVGEPVHICRPDLERKMRSHSLFWPLWLTSRSSTTWTAGAPMDRPSSSSPGKQLQPITSVTRDFKNSNRHWRNITTTTCKTGVPMIGEIKRTVEESRQTKRSEKCDKKCPKCKDREGNSI